MLVVADPEYERIQRELIIQQADQLECINNWVQHANNRLDMGEVILINDLIIQIMQAENNTKIAFYTAFDLMQPTFPDPGYNTEIYQVLEKAERINLQLWRIQISDK